MKKLIYTFVMFSFLIGMVVFASPEPASAQTYMRRVVRNGRVTYVRVRKPSYYRRHRNRINMAAGTGAGALIGGLIGGGKGAVIGGATGLGASSLYTYKFNKKKRRYVKVRRY
jgi:outer membrane lipoprotein SlyB